MAFLKLKRLDTGVAVLVSVEKVEGFAAVEGGTQVNFENGNSEYVKESLQTIGNRLESVGYSVAKS